MADSPRFAGFSFPEKGSRVLGDWMRERQLQAALQRHKKLSVRKFAGAAVDRLTASLQQWSGSVNSDLDSSLVILRSRARGLAANTEFGRRFLSLVATNIVGPDGPTLQVRAKTDGANPVLDKAANATIERHYHRWGKSCDITGRMSLPHLLRVAVKSAARDGEALVRVVRNRNLLYGIAVQILEADRLDESINMRRENGNLIRMGVEVDSTARAVAYWIKSAHPGENHNLMPSTAQRVPASEIYHLFLTERAEQVRGYTWFHAVLIRATMLHGFEEAAVTAARIGAAKVAAFVKREDNGAPLAGERIADGLDSSSGLPQTVVEPGEFMDLTGTPGVELQSWSPEYPHANFQSFMQACMHGLASGLDVATHNLSGDMSNVNYSSARIAELAERDIWRTLQAWLIDSLVDPLYRDWLQTALLNGSITFDGSGKALPATKFSKFADASTFQGRRWAWVDPQKEAKAMRDMIDGKLASRTQVVASIGRDFEDVVQELKQEDDMLREADLKSEPPPAPQSVAPTDDTEDE